jgi:hypothetical protein
MMYEVAISVLDLDLDPLGSVTFELRRSGSVIIC